MHSDQFTRTNPSYIRTELMEAYDDQANSFISTLRTNVLQFQLLRTERMWSHVPPLYVTKMACVSKCLTGTTMYGLEHACNLLT